MEFFIIFNQILASKKVKVSIVWRNTIQVALVPYCAHDRYLFSKFSDSIIITHDYFLWWPIRNNDSSWTFSEDDGIKKALYIEHDGSVINSYGSNSSNFDAIRGNFWLQPWTGYQFFIWICQIFVDNSIIDKYSRENMRASVLSTHFWSARLF